MRTEVYITDDDRRIDLNLEVTYSYRPATRDGRITPGEGPAIEIESVELTGGLVWFDDIGLSIVTVHDDDGTDRLGNDRILRRYHAEIEASVLEEIEHSACSGV